MIAELKDGIIESVGDVNVMVEDDAVVLIEDADVDIERVSDDKVPDKSLSAVGT